MDNLADKVIKANDEAKDNGPELDDIGFPLPRHKTPHSMCEYLTARLLFLNQHMYQHDGRLWLNDEKIPETKQSYYHLAKYPKKISDVQCTYVWRRCFELVPKLDTDVIAVLPDVTFNMRTGEFRYERVRTTTPW